MKSIPVRRIASAQTEGGGMFSIRNVAELLNGQDLLHELHRHDFYFILALEQGSGMHEIDFVNYPITAHSIFLLRPGQVHQLKLDAGSTGLLIEFDREFYHPTDNVAAGRLKRAYSKKYCATDSVRFHKLMRTLNSIYDEMAEKAEGYQAAVRAYLDVFFIEFIRSGKNPTTAQTSASDYTQEKFEELTVLLNEQIATLKNVAQYASLLNLSSYQLNAITKAAVGKTASELINEQMILEAKRHLLATSAQVKDIAFHLGYEDISYFIRFFKKHTGSTPEAFRQKSK